MNPLVTTVFYKPQFLIRALASGLVVSVQASTSTAACLERPSAPVRD